MRRFKNKRLLRSLALLTLLLLLESCTKSRISHSPESTNEPEYKILSKTQAGGLFGKIRSQNADIQSIQQFFMTKSFYFNKAEALKQGSRAACIAFYSARGDNDHLGILAIKLQGDTGVETIAGILWLNSPCFANEPEGPKLASSSTTCLCAWWSCVFNNVGLPSQLQCPGRDPYSPAKRVACLESFRGLPMVYYWFRYCY